MEATGARRSKLDFTEPSPVFSSSKLPLMSTPALPRLLALLLPLLLYAGRVGDSGSPWEELAEDVVLLVETLRNAFFQSEPASAPETFLSNAGGGGTGGGAGLRLFVAFEAWMSPPSSAEPTRWVRPPP